MTNPELHNDVIVIGAGPSGAIAAALLCQQGYGVSILEKQHFPRFSIGESLLPQCMEFVEQAGMLPAVQAAGFQFKNGAAFHRAGKNSTIDFRQKFSPGWGTTFQVQRGTFDQILAEQARLAGADLRYGQEITAVDFSGASPHLTVRSDCGATFTASARFVLDASGFGRVLPRLLNLELPSGFPIRMSLFTHIEDHITTSSFDREKILITVHPQHRDVWYWLIPFSNGRSSIGVVASPEYIQSLQGDTTHRLRSLVNQDPNLRELLAATVWDMPAREITGYSCNVRSLWGQHFALLGNAGEFLDPVFSSGVTIAMKSASLAAEVLHRQLSGATVDWESDYAVPLKRGVNTFRTFVEAWYEGGFQDVIFAEQQSASIRAMISSILAGYAWDTNNPYVRESRRRLDVLVETCQGLTAPEQQELPH